MDMGLRGKNAVITGGSVGIGLAVARGLAAEGANVTLVARGRRMRRQGSRRRSASTRWRSARMSPPWPAPIS